MVKWLGLLTGLVLALASCAKSESIRCGDVTCGKDTHCGPNNECVPDSCGDGTFNPDIELCDGKESVTQRQLRCSDFDFYKQSTDIDPISCTETCEFDLSNCSERCGDNTINGPERCDGLPPTGAACADFGFDVGRLGCTDACEPAFDHCTSVGWQLLPGGATNELRAVVLTGPGSGVAVGTRGQIIAAKDGVWIPVVSPTTEDLNGVFVNPAGIVAVGNKGTILRYDGTTITTMTSPTTEDLYAISGGTLGAFAVGANGTILRYDNTTWTKMPSPVGVGYDLRAVSVIDATTAYAVGSQVDAATKASVAAVVLKWSGTVWTNPALTNTLPTTALYAVRVFPNDVVFVAGDAQTTDEVPIARIVNGTITTPAPFKYPDGVPAASFRAIWGETPNNLFFGGVAGAMMFWNGTSLSAQDTPTDRTILGLSGVGTRVIGVTRGGSVIGTSGSAIHVNEVASNPALFTVFTDGTTSVVAGNDVVMLRDTKGAWQATSTGTADIRSLFATGTNVWAAEPIIGSTPPAASIYFYRAATLDGPLTYQSTFTANTDESISGIWGTAPKRLFAVGWKKLPTTPVTYEGKIWEFADGSTFTAPVTSATYPSGIAKLNDVWGAKDGTLFAVGDGGLVLQLGPTANAWTTQQTNVPNNHLLSVWGTSANDVFAVGTSGVILHWDGTAWKRMYTGVAENLVAVSGNSASDVFVSGTGLLRMHYDGLSWSRMPAPATDLDMSTAAGTTYHVYGSTIERFQRGDFTTETSCTDAWDNNSDGKTNCDDMDCYGERQCIRGGACETEERVTCNTTALPTSSFTGTARIDSLPCLDHLTPGPEASYRYVAETSGPVTVTIESAEPTATFALDLVVADATAGHCELDTCRKAEVSGASQSVTFDTTAGNIYYIVVDGPVGVAQAFTLSVSCN